MTHAHTATKETYLRVKRDLPMPKETYLHVKRDLPTCQKRPNYITTNMTHAHTATKETYLYAKRDLPMPKETYLCQKRPTYMSKETYLHVYMSKETYLHAKRDLLACQKRPTYITAHMTHAHTATEDAGMCVCDVCFYVSRSLLACR